MESGLSTEEKLIEIAGVVIPVDWDSKGRILAAAIATSDEDEYRIEEGDKGGKLLGMIHENVRVSGQVREEEGKKVIRVMQCKLQRKRGRKHV